MLTMSRKLRTRRRPNQWPLPVHPLPENQDLRRLSANDLSTCNFTLLILMMVSYFGSAFIDVTVYTLLLVSQYIYADIPGYHHCIELLWDHPP